MARIQRIHSIAQEIQVNRGNSAKVYREDLTYPSSISFDSQSFGNLKKARSVIQERPEFHDDLGV